MAEPAEPVKAEETTTPSAAQHPFPSGLRVLVVDDDPLCLKVVGHMLRRCSYEVTTSINGMSALEELRQHPNHYDLVLSDVYMPDMDGFKLLEHIGLELDLPVIMMSSNGETNVVLRGVTHGAVDFLIKPVRIEELRNAWQHVVRRRRESAVSKDSGEEADEEAAKRNDKKRKSEDKRRSGEHSDGEGTSAKKARVVWSIEMHQQFVNAVNTLGVDKAVPKRILDLMNVEGLTRENVASHLQKYRLYLRRVSGVAPTAGSGRGGGKGVRMPVMPGVGLAAGVAEPAAPGAVPAAAVQAPATQTPQAPGAEAGAAAAPMAGFASPPMGMQQGPMMQPGAAGAVPDHIMRLQLQTLQMQAMSLGVGAGLPGALPCASTPTMAGGMAAPGMQALGSAAMPPAGFGQPGGMTLGGLPGIAGMPTGAEFAMPPVGAFTGDMSWATMAGQAVYPGSPEQQAVLAGRSAPASGPGLQLAPEAQGNPLQQPQPQPQPVMQQPTEQPQQHQQQQHHQQQQVAQHASPPPQADQQQQQQLQQQQQQHQVPQQPVLQQQQQQPQHLRADALQQAPQHQLQLSFDQQRQQQQMAAAVGQYPGLPFGPMGPQPLPGYPPQLPAFPQHQQQPQHLQQPQPQQQGHSGQPGGGGGAAEDPKDGSMDDMLNFFLKDGNAPD